MLLLLHIHPFLPQILPSTTQSLASVADQSGSAADPLLLHMPLGTGHLSGHLVGGPEQYTQI